MWPRCLTPSTTQLCEVQVQVPVLQVVQVVQVQVQVLQVLQVVQVQVQHEYLVESLALRTSATHKLQLLLLAGLAGVLSQLLDDVGPGE